MSDDYGPDYDVDDDDYGDGYPHWRPPPKRPPPESGIKMKQAGTTWWGQRWIAALEAMSAAYANRLPRGRAYARAGRTHDLSVQPGKVTARVTGTRPRPYRVTMALPCLDDATWEAAIQAMASRAIFSARLLAGEMPEDIDEAFQGAGASLFPDRPEELETGCSCPDWANPCKHVAATHYVLGEALDRDPFLLFELRGRTRAQVLDALRAARGGAAARGAADEASAGEEGDTRAGRADAPAVVLERMASSAYDGWRDGVPRLPIAVRPPDVRGALLGQLGAPPSWSLNASPAALLGPLLEAASARAMAIALGEDDGDAGSEEHPPPDEARASNARRAPKSR